MNKSQANVLNSVEISFLTSGPTMTLTIPDILIPSPLLEAPIDLSNGGARAVVFFPLAYEPPRFDDESHRELPSLQDAVGRTVRVFERMEQPSQWYLIWDLVTGTVLTHLREEDGVGMAESIVESLEIVDAPGGTPVVLPSAPLQRAASRLPGYQETVTFHDSAREPQVTLELSRPGALGPATKTTRKIVNPAGPAVVETRIATGVGIDIKGRGLAEPDMASLADQVRLQIQQP